MVERRQRLDRRAEAPKQLGVFHFPKIKIGAKIWMCLISLVLMLGGYVHANLRGSENFSTYVWGILGVLGIYAGANVTQKFSPYGSSFGGSMYPPINFSGGSYPPVNQGQYPTFPGTNPPIVTQPIPQTKKE